ncbi:hypothetical protein SLH49_22020 [Cognatiyoonia sp. IB215446]|uniref:hypothetical protein n=1 Tax=Cognatiyoonia sp. IB215446 TaxID=3097355 RepID=UPI002A14D978|nr:hypothetical protein [Cognatiyoonia sp. IB215446]MDX8350676.1 hypothetical protein [Cognatiyoonia sp. IB215446]
MVFQKPLACSRENGFRTPQTYMISRFLDSFKKKHKVVRSSGPSSNSSLADFEDAASSESDPSTDLNNTDIDALFEELERWHDVLKPHADMLRGPRP